MLLTLREDEVAVLEDVDEAAGRGDDDLAALAQAHALVLARQAANDGHGADAQVFAELDRLLLDLLRQLARRRQDDGVRARLVVAETHVLRQRLDPHQQRNEEGRRLARARLGHADDVAVLQTFEPGPEKKRVHSQSR